jgi:two-component system, LuxR family, response regulator FixJ
MLFFMNERRQPADCLTVYVVDSDMAVREGLSALLAGANVMVRTFASAEEFLSELPATGSGCLVAEVHLPGMDGLELLERLRTLDIQMPAIMLASCSDVPTAVRAMRCGAMDFIDKPFIDRVLLSRVRQALAIAGARNPVQIN